MQTAVIPAPENSSLHPERETGLPDDGALTRGDSGRTGVLLGVDLTPETNGGPVGLRCQLSLGRELVDEREPTAAVASGVCGTPPAAVVGDGDADLPAGDGCA